MKRETFDLAKSKAADLERQIADCKLVVPKKGMLVLAEGVAEGATVRQRQKLFTIPDLEGPMRVVFNTPEARIDRITPGQAARVMIDAFPQKTPGGVVESVAPMPDQKPSSLPRPRNFTTVVTINDGPRGVRPGMTARVEVLTTLEGVLAVPVEAVVRYIDSRRRVAVKTPEGGTDGAA